MMNKKIASYVLMGIIGTGGFMWNNSKVEQLEKQVIQEKKNMAELVETNSSTIKQVMEDGKEHEKTMSNLSDGSKIMEIPDLHRYIFFPKDSNEKVEFDNVGDMEDYVQKYMSEKKEAPKQEINTEVKKMSTSKESNPKFEKVTPTRQDIENISCETTSHEDLKEIAENKGLKEFKKIITYYSNGSVSIEYPQLEQYYFTPYEMGDFDYHFDNKQMLDNAIKTYISMKATGTY